MPMPTGRSHSIMTLFPPRYNCGGGGAEPGDIQRPLRLGYTIVLPIIGSCALRRILTLSTAVCPNTCIRMCFVGALEHGKHVYMDKPAVLQRSMKRRAMAEAGRTHPDSIVQMTFKTALFSALQRAKQLIEAGRWGTVFDPGFAICTRVCDPPTPFTGGWMSPKSGRGGLFLIWGCMPIDLIRFLFGSSPSFSSR